MNQIVNAVCKLNSGKRSFAVLMLCAATAISLPAQIFTTLHNFNYNDAAGSNPDGGLVLADNGDLYGTTAGDVFGGPASQGTVFKITQDGTITTLYTFHGKDGALPQAHLVLANGSLYGTTSEGGASWTGPSLPGFGTVFKIAPDGTLTTLHSFNNVDGFNPSTLVRGDDRDFYGTTSLGGAHGLGTAFKISARGTLTTLYSFCSQTGCTDGSVPTAGLVQADNGDFYGTTGAAGAGPFCVPAPGGGPCGTIFKLTPGGALTTLYSFCSQPNCSDGSSPGKLVQAKSGDLYGTTERGGDFNSFPCYSGCGTVFKLTPHGALTQLYRFSGSADGGVACVALVQASDWNFYGTTATGGAFGGGTIFKITPSGELTTLHGFNPSTDGVSPQTPLVDARSGTFYGTASGGGSNNAGTFFSLEVFVRMLPTFGDVGSAVRILGTNLSGASSVTFDGIPAVFQVDSPFEITTIVPSGASTGEVQVVLPGGTLSSTVPFRVL
jgi:uncharacterized repeat protein (TIGR03803 family)